MSNRAARWMKTAAVVALALALGGCGGDRAVSLGPLTTQRPPAEVGNFQWQPRTVGTAKNLREARTREAHRLADVVVLPPEIDPDYVINDEVESRRSYVVLDGTGLADVVVNDTFDTVAHNLVAGSRTQWSSRSDDNDKSRQLTIAVLEFPDSASAAAVATTLERDDFTYHRDNEPVHLVRYPGTAAHWRPRVSSLGAWTAHERFVVFVKFDDERRAPDLPSLTAEVERTLDAQLPLLDQFAPTASEKLLTIELDPEGLFGRTLDADPTAWPVDRVHVGAYAGRGGWEPWWSYGRGKYSERIRPDALAHFQVDQVAIGDTVVARTRTEEAAQALLSEERRLMDQHADSAEPPITTPADIGCFLDAQYPATGAVCLFRVGRHVVKAKSKHTPTLRQMIAAQHMLLVGA